MILTTLNFVYYLNILKLILNEFLTNFELILN